MYAYQNQQGRLETMLVDLQGQIERITYTNDENGYTVSKVKMYDRRDLVTVVGNLMAPMPGEILKMQGEWANHSKFGDQFKVVHYESRVPDSVTGIEKYLGSGLIKGIGPILAKRIVKKFEKETLDIIEQEIEKLIEVDGIGRKRIEMIKKAWADQKEIRQVMIFLQSHEVSSTYATKIFKTYGKQSVAMIQENPYRLATDIFGIGFLTADRIAEKLEFAKDSAHRAEAGVLHVLRQLADDGHVYYPFQALVNKCQKIFKVDQEILSRALRSLNAKKKIVIDDLQEKESQADYQAVYLAKFHLSETNIATRLKALTNAPKSIRPIDPDKALKWVRKQLDITLASKQIEAVRRAVTDKVLVITGGPGTGKTTIVNAILKIFVNSGVKLLLAAPTGRAAKRMSEATGHEAKTIHRLLEYSIQKDGFQKNAQTPLECDLLIIDEASMIDTILMHHLLKAIPPKATFILVGDVNQLPSVGAGNVLHDIIASGALPVMELNEIFRQDRESLIIVYAHKIKQGQMPAFEPSDHKLADFSFIEEEKPEKVLGIIFELVKERIPKRVGFDPIEDIQVLTPMHKGIVGAGNLNLELQNALNPVPDSLSWGGKNFRINDKVMQIHNNYEKEVFNGDIGRIARINVEGREVTIDFDGKKVPYDYPDLNEVVLAYAISIHKSQGSEYPAVVIPIVTQHSVLLQRNLIYTAVTRGKKLVVMVGSKRALAIGIGNDKTRKRYTYLRNRLSL
jgi:exodeoxyribonuclease V alpha subunit